MSTDSQRTSSDRSSDHSVDSIDGHGNGDENGNGHQNGNGGENGHENGVENGNGNSDKKKIKRISPPQELEFYINSDYKLPPYLPDSVSTIIPPPSKNNPPPPTKTNIPTTRSNNRALYVTSSKWHRRFRTVIIAGVGFFCDAYDVFVINIVLFLLSNSSSTQDNPLTSSDKSFISTAVIVGSLFGQLIFGYVGDTLGRKQSFVITLALVVSGTIASVFVFNSPVMSLATMLALCRFVLGFGIGGEYPLSATIVAETTTTHERGRMLAAVFSLQGLGALTSSIVALTLIGIFGHTDPHKIDLTWRVCIAMGAVPGLLTFYLRVTMEETKEFKHSQELESTCRVSNSSDWSDLSDLSTESCSESSSSSDSEESEESEESFGRRFRKRRRQHAMETQEGESPLLAAIDRKWHQAQRKLKRIQQYRKILFGTAASWFLLDITFYANGLFSATILRESGIAISDGVGGVEGGLNTEGTDIMGVLAFNVLITAIALPGYWVALWLIETRLGRKNLQLAGFLCMMILYLCIGFAFTWLEKFGWAWFVIFYALSFFFSNAGPSTTTYVLAAESFPTEIRSTCHGISAAAGKTGAVVGTAFMASLMHSLGLGTIFLGCGAVAGVGALVTFVFVKETVGKSLTDIITEEDFEIMEQERLAKENEQRERGEFGDPVPEIKPIGNIHRKNRDVEKGRMDGLEDDDEGGVDDCDDDDNDGHRNVNDSGLVIEDEVMSDEEIVRDYEDDEDTGV